MILDQIVAYKKGFVEHCQRVNPLVELKSRITDLAFPTIPFVPAIKRDPDGYVRCIAEVKKASPSKGIIREYFDPVRLAMDYQDHQADAISVLTDEEFFQGHLDYLRDIRREIDDTPLLRKDFTIGEYQIYEARLSGASAILLIAAILDRHQLSDYKALAEDLGMGVLTEVHTEREADLVAEIGIRVIGINNRNLHDFSVDIGTTQCIVRLLDGPRPEFVFVSESGLSKPADIDYVHRLGVDAILVGESLMREPSPGHAMDVLLGRMDESDPDFSQRRRGDFGGRRLGNWSLGDEQD
jgi:indole-3-glycerol phosphate synthase